MFNYSVKKTVVSVDVVIKLVSVTEVKGKGHVQRERVAVRENRETCLLTRGAYINRIRSY